MQAIELEASITTSHEIHLQLPDTIKASRAKVIVMYDNDTAVSLSQKRVFGQFRGKITIAENFDDELPMTYWVDDES